VLAGGRPCGGGETGATEFGAQYIFGYIANNNPASYYFAPRHGEGANVLYCDGHVKWQAENNLLAAKWWTRLND